MKSKRRSFPRSAPTIQRRILGNGDRTLVESKCPACGQIVDTVMDESLQRGEPAASFPDLKKLLHLSQHLYAHALTLQEMIRTEGEVTYEALRPKYDGLATQQFKMFRRALKQSSGLRKRGPGLRANVLMLKEAASRGRTGTLRELLEAGVPLVPLPAPKPTERYMAVPFDSVGWLNSASSHPEVLSLLIDVGASQNDQSDKDLALAGAARSGKVEAARALVNYGANANADFSKQIVTETNGGMTMGTKGAGSVLIYAAASGNPEMVREILRYHPKLEMQDREGKTAVFAAGEYRYGDQDGARVECLRLLAHAGANVNARDNEGNTPLHETFLTDVEEELLKVGADVNARNNKGETPIFTTVNDEAIALFIAHGADLSIRNNKGETVIEAAKEKGPSRQRALREAIQNLKEP